MTRIPGRSGVLHIIVPQRAGAVGGADLHVGHLAATSTGSMRRTCRHRPYRVRMPFGDWSTPSASV